MPNNLNKTSQTLYITQNILFKLNLNWQFYSKITVDNQLNWLPCPKIKLQAQCTLDVSLHWCCKMLLNCRYWVVVVVCIVFCRWRYCVDLIVNRSLKFLIRFVANTFFLMLCPLAYFSMFFKLIKYKPTAVKFASNFFFKFCR